jgi:hypothetical protein
MEKKRDNARHLHALLDAVRRVSISTPAKASRGGSQLRPHAAGAAISDPYQRQDPHPRVSPVSAYLPPYRQPWTVWFRFCPRALLRSNDPDISPTTLPVAFYGSFDTCAVLCQPCTHGGAGCNLHADEKHCVSCILILSSPRHRRGGIGDEEIRVHAALLAACELQETAVRTLAVALPEMQSVQSPS